jgi:hypothetical protein
MPLLAPRASSTHACNANRNRATQGRSPQRAAGCYHKGWLLCVTTSRNHHRGGGALRSMLQSSRKIWQSYVNNPQQLQGQPSGQAAARRPRSHHGHRSMPQPAAAVNGTLLQRCTSYPHAAAAVHGRVSVTRPPTSHHGCTWRHESNTVQHQHIAATPPGAVHPSTHSKPLLLADCSVKFRQHHPLPVCNDHTSGVASPQIRPEIRNALLAARNPHTTCFLPTQRLLTPLPHGLLHTPP